MILDLLIVLALVALLARGWGRGFTREAMDLGALLLAAVLAFRLAPVVGGVLVAMSGMSPEGSRLIGGLLVFFGLWFGAAAAARSLEDRFGLAELTVANRAGGAGLAATWGAFLTTLMLTLAAILPVPVAVAEQMEGSAISRTLTDPDGVAQRTFTRLAGDRLIESLLHLRELVGGRRVVIGPDEVLEIPAARPQDLRADHEAAAEVFELLNLARIDAGLEPLAWSEPLADVALRHAFDMYLNGFFAHDSPSSGDLGDRLRAASITFRIAGENLALAVTPTEVHRGLMDSPGHRANILGTGYRRVGVGVVSGRLGLMTVQVFTG